MRPSDVIHDMVYSALNDIEKESKAFFDARAEEAKKREAFYKEVEEALAPQPTEEEIEREEARERWSGQKGMIGYRDSEEPEEEIPVRREIRHDSGARTVAIVKDDEWEEGDADASYHRSGLPVSDADDSRDERDDDDDGWSSGTRRFGHYEDDE